jgi:hypothetical protein
MTGIHRDTIMRLLVEVGAGWSAPMDERRRDLGCRRIQVDEIWAYVQKKQRQVRAADDRQRFGDFWTFVAIHADTKLIPTYRVGKRYLPTAAAFMDDLASRATKSDALRTYVDATERVFGADVDYGQLVKAHEAEPGARGAFLLDRHQPVRVFSGSYWLYECSAEDEKTRHSANRRKLGHYPTPVS